MNSKGIFLTAAGCLGAIVALGQTPPQQGPGVQAPQDARYADAIAKCKVPPPQRGGGGGGGGRGGGAAAAPAGRGEGRGGDARGGNNAAAGPPAKQEYKVEAIPGVIAAGQQWKSVWTGTGNNADGIIATKDGGILAAQNTDSKVMKIDKDGKVSFPYMDTNTGGAVSMNKKGALFLVSRGLPASVLQLAPMRKVLANMYNGDPLDCIGGVINDLTAASNGNVYFTMGAPGQLFRVDPKGVVTKGGTITGTNGLVLSPDEKILYVTGRIASSPPAPPQGQPNPGSLIAYDVQPDGSLKNERQFAMAGSDGSTVDAQGRIYTTSNTGVKVVGPDGKLLGTIPTPLNFITVAFSGPDKKTLYGVANNQRFDEIFTIQMIAQGYKGRPK
jgi:gluconolactonase